MLGRAIAVETDMRDNVTIKALMEAVAADANEAMEQIVYISPLNHEAIAENLVKMKTLVYIRGVIARVLRAGQAAEVALRAEDDEGQE